MKKLILIILLFTITIVTGRTDVRAQKPEVGVSLILSGAIMFGPYFSYRIDDHHCFEASVLAAYEKKLVFPFTLNGSYNYYVGSKNWRPKIGLQYSLLISPVRHKSEDDPGSLSLISLIPGVQYRWDNTRQNIIGQVWVSYFIKNKKIFPIGLEGRYGFMFK
ncbi:MAG: hypothetical protein U1C46_03465 [Bacteroidales bacterium]|nr:hypothetical protein [Bacteroidales bacterium]MDZ4203858.1 hypothetical protein [Bacteroidales bacterium]